MTKNGTKVTILKKPYAKLDENGMIPWKKLQQSMKKKAYILSKKTTYIRLIKILIFIHFELFSAHSSMERTFFVNYIFLSSFVLPFNYFSLVQPHSIPPNVRNPSEDIPSGSRGTADDKKQIKNGAPFKYPRRIRQTRLY